ncbi:MAG: hypothetical protein QM742_18735 [Aquabacterium sp.]
MTEFASSEQDDEELLTHSETASGSWFTPHWLTHRWVTPALVLLGLLMVAPVIRAGLSMDDFLHWSILFEGPMVEKHPGSPWGLFHFVSGDPAQIRSLKESGLLMWWASDDLRMAFWRPLSEFTHWLDYRLWPHQPAWMHVHSLLWYGALLLLLSRLYLTLSPSVPAWASLAVLFFIASRLHLPAVAWVAARNQLISACFAVACITAFHLWRVQGRRVQGLVAAVMLALALLSAEAGVFALGYLVAHVLIYPRQAKHDVARVRDTWRARFKDLLPFLVIVLVWRLLYASLGYGSTGSGHYIDPGAHPARFLEALVTRLPTLLLAQTWGAPSAVSTLLPLGQQQLFAVAAAALTGLWIVAAKRHGLWRSTLARFLATGAVLSLLPLCASEAADRLLLGAEVGASGLFALLLTHMWERGRPAKTDGWHTRGAWWIACASMAVHLGWFPLQKVLQTSYQKEAFQQGVLDPLSLPDGRGDPAARVVLINPPMAFMTIYYPSTRHLHGVDNPASMHTLANGMQGLTMTIDSADTLTLRGPRSMSFVDRFSRDVITRPFKVGEPIAAGAFEATVTELSAEGFPQAVRFRFSRPLNDPDWRFYLWTEAGYVPYVPPRPGTTVSLEAPDLAGIVKRQMLGESPPRVRMVGTAHAEWGRGP